MPDDFVKVAAVSDVSPGDMKVVDVGDDQILLVNVDGEVHACDDICSHAYASCPKATWTVRRSSALSTRHFQRQDRQGPYPAGGGPLRTFEVRVTETTFSWARHGKARSRAAALRQAIHHNGRGPGWEWRRTGCLLHEQPTGRLPTPGAVLNNLSAQGPRPHLTG